MTCKPQCTSHFARCREMEISCTLYSSVTRIHLLYLISLLGDNAVVLTSMHLCRRSEQTLSLTFQIRTHVICFLFKDTVFSYCPLKFNLVRLWKNKFGLC